MNNPSKILIKNSISIKKCFEILNKTEEKLLIVINKKNKFIGVINDGDLRRAMLSGATLETSINRFIKQNSLFVNKNTSKSQALNLLSAKKIVLPVIDAKNEVVGYYSLKDKYNFHQFRNNNVTVIGMGYVGLTLSCILAEKNFNVIGYDNNLITIKKLKNKKTEIFESGLQSHLDTSVGKNLNFTSKLSLNDCSIYIVSVGTFIKKNNKPNLMHIKNAIKELSKFLKSGDLIIFRSTLPIGTTNNTLIPLINKISNLYVGKDISVAFAPERTAEGVALKELKENPQIVGGYDDLSASKAISFFNSFSPTVIKVSSLEAAELCKLLDNSYRDNRFAFINQFVPLAENLKINLNNIVDAVNQGYPRNNLPKPSPSVGGTCLYKDPHILASAFEKFNLDNSLIKTSRKINEKGHKYLFLKLFKMLKSLNKDKSKIKIFLIGIAFKGFPETADLRESTSIWFLSQFKSKKNIYAFDYNVSKKEIEKLNVKYSTINNGFKNADAVVILNNHKKYNDLNITKLANLMNKPAVFLDSWHTFDPEEIKNIKGIYYGGLGND